jgi:voltage-gated potassium channel Kch
MGTVIILGEGHLATKVKQRLAKERLKFVQVPEERIRALEKREQFAAIEKLLRKYDWKSVRAVCIVDEEESINLNLALIVLAVTKNVPIYVSIDNKYLTPYLHNIRQECLRVFNPATIAAPYFVEALLSNMPQQRIPVQDRQKPKKQLDLLLVVLGVLFIGLVAASTIFFSKYEGLPFLDALYFTVTTVATVGYGDINLLNASPTSKVFGILLMFASTILVWLFFSFVIERLMKKRYEIELGKKRYRLKDHIIVCGLGRLGYRVTAVLTEKDKKVLAIESNSESAYIDIAREKGAYLFIGDASISRTLLDAGVQDAAGVIVAIDDELKAIEVGLQAKSLNPSIPVIFRVYDEMLAQKLRSQMKIRHAYSTSTIAAEYLVKEIKGA